VDSSGANPRKVSDVPTRVVWDQRSGDLLQLRRSADDASIELWQSDPVDVRWWKRSRLDFGALPPIQFEFLPLTVDRSTGRLVMNRRTGSSRLVVFDGVEIARW
jgi:hypothetical protein